MFKKRFNIFKLIGFLIVLAIAALFIFRAAVTKSIV